MLVTGAAVVGALQVRVSPRARRNASAKRQALDQLTSLQSLQRDMVLCDEELAHPVVTPEIANDPDAGNAAFSQLSLCPCPVHCYC